MPWGVEYLPIGVPEAEHLTVGEGFVDGVGGDRLIEVLGGAALRSRRASTSASGALAAGGAPHLQPGVAADVVGVPVGIDHSPQVRGVRIYPRGGLLGVPDEAAVDERGCAPADQQQVRVRERPLLSDQLLGKPIV
ncbi:hypothetical protein, partial [Rhodococcus indonesiensis]